jgi:hypothetical protein
VRAALTGHQAVGVAAGERELGRHDAGLGGRADLVDLQREARALGPTAVHPQQDLGPVLRVDAAVLGVDLHDAVGLVVLAGEQAAQVELTQLLARADRCAVWMSASCDSSSTSRAISCSSSTSSSSPLSRRRCRCRP